MATKMTLENLRNLEKIGQLKSHVTGKEEMQRLLEASIIADHS